MTADKTGRFWLLATFLLILVIVLSAVVIWTRYDRGRPIEIVTAPEAALNGTISVEGAVNNPGLYPSKTGDTLDSIIAAAGGTKDTAGVNQVRLYIPQSGENEQAQLIDLNHADAWLLCSLPDIGETRAAAIVAYRDQNGPFSSIHDVTRVKGISESTFQKIKGLITLMP
jgi:competence protein ComEA